MSELKTINAYQLTTNTEDSDVYIHNDEFDCGGDLIECYLKSEADKVIAEKEAEIEKLDDCIRDYSEKTKTLVIANLDMQRREDRQKYKRCLAMPKVMLPMLMVITRICDGIKNGIKSGWNLPRNSKQTQPPSRAKDTKWKKKHSTLARLSNSSRKARRCAVLDGMGKECSSLCRKVAP